MKIPAIFLLIILSLSAKGQLQFDDYAYKPDSIKIGSGKTDFMQKGPRGYKIFLPENMSNFSGTILSLDDYPLYGPDTLKYINFNKEANKLGFAVINIASGIPYDMFFNDSSCQFVDKMLIAVFTKYHIPNRKIELLGVMGSGHRALKYVEYVHKNKSKFKSEIKAIVLCEAAIDWVRQWYEAQKQIRDKLSEVGFFEGKTTTYLLNTNLHSTPATGINNYLEFSPYSYFDTKQRYAQLYKDIPIRCYSFADTNYWFAAKGKGVFDSNYPDMSGIINEQKLAGNKRAALTVFTNTDKPDAEKQKAQTDTWELINKSELLNWLTKMSN